MAEILDFSDVAQSVKEYDRIIRGQLTNEVISSYYDDMAAFSKADYDYDAYSLFSNKASNLRSCHRVMNFGHYVKQGIKDFKGTIYCHDRYCPNCAKLIANTREQKFQKILAMLEPQYDFYHMVLTFKNVRGSVLSRNSFNTTLPHLAPYIKTMSKSFKQLTRYFTGNIAVAGLDFSSYGYAGAVRTLEITYKEHQEYHPHYHALVAMKKGINFTGKTINAFSHNKFTKKVTPFSDFEITLQKIWYLVINGEKVTSDAINNLKIGYSCCFKKVLPKESHDVFKYVVKPDKGALMTASIFQDLFFSLKGMRSIQTYGCFHGLHIEDDEIDDTNDAVYDKLIDYLNRYELPQDCSEAPSHVRDNIAAKKFIYISRRSIRSYVKSIGRDDEDFSFVASPSRIGEFMQIIMPEVLNMQTSSLLYLDGGKIIKPKNASKVVDT